LAISSALLPPLSLMPPVNTAPAPVISRSLPASETAPVTVPRLAIVSPAAVAVIAPVIFAPARLLNRPDPEIVIDPDSALLLIRVPASVIEP
jgi:hypothetical protein